MIETTLQDCLIAVIDNRGVTPHKRGTEWQDTGVPVLSANNVKTSGLQKLDEIRYIPEEIYPLWMKMPLEKGDIIMTSEAPAGEVYYWDSDAKVVLGQRLFGLKVKNDINSKYLKYYLQSSIGQKAIKGQNSGSTVFGIAASTFPQIVLNLLEREDQDVVADLLYDIDLKISNNNAICADLEAMAKLLYDYWFVQFDFPDENGKPYKSSGGKMVWNEELKREIPERWEAGALGDVLEKYSDGIAPAQVGELPYTPMDILPMNKMSFSEIGSQDDANSSLIRYKKYSVLFGAMRPYFHRVCIAPFDGVTRTTVFTLREKSQGELGFAYETINQDYAVKYATDHHVGTQQPYAEWEKNLDCCPIPIPPRELRLKYSRKIENYIDAVIEKNMENQQLASLRDFLLPMLMNGQVKVGGKGNLPPVKFPVDEARGENLVAAEPQNACDAEGKGV